MRTIILTLFLALSLSPGEAQNKFRAELEIDPIAYALNGYSVHAIGVYQRFRLDAGIFGIQQPESYSGNEGFSTYTRGIGFKLNYLLNKKESWFAGIGSGFSTNTITDKESGEQAKQEVFSVGLHLGYRWFLLQQKNNAWKGLYLAPWMSVDRNFTSSAIHLADREYKQSNISLFPTLHIGYKF